MSFLLDGNKFIFLDKVPETKKLFSLFCISVTFNLILILILTGAGASQLCRRARTPRKRACTTLGAF